MKKAIQWERNAASGKTHYRLLGHDLYGPFSSSTPASYVTATFLTNFSSTLTAGTYTMTVDAWMGTAIWTADGTGGEVSARWNVTPPPTGSITIHPITTTVNTVNANSSVITGTITNNRLSPTASENTVRITIDGMNYTAPVNPDGTYSLAVPAGVTLAQGSIITVLGSNGLVTNSANTTVQAAN